MTRRTRRTAQQWQAIIDRQADSGESASKFCDSNALSLSSILPLACQVDFDEADSPDREAGSLDRSIIVGVYTSTSSLGYRA